MFVANKDTEAIDRTDLALPGYQDELVEAVAAANPRTVVVLNTGGPVLMPWLGEVAGRARGVVPRRGGRQRRGGRAARRRRPVRPAADHVPEEPRRHAGEHARAVSGRERRRDATPRGSTSATGTTTRSDIEPLFPFGYGLSYTTFRLSDLHVTGGKHGQASAVVNVTNTGHRRGAQVVQVYVGGADDSGPLGAGQIAPPRRLEGFAKVWLNPGQHRTLPVQLGPRAFAHWDSDRKAWVQSAGTYTVSAGTSSRDLPLRQQVRRVGTVVKG